MPLRRHAFAVALTVPSLALGQAPTITIHAGTVLDGRGGVARNTTIVVAGSHIIRLDPALTTATYDLGRLTVMPGGIDTHVHLASHFDANGRAHNDPGGAEPLQQTVLYAEENAYHALLAGITTVQSIGSTLDRELHRRRVRADAPRRPPRGGGVQAGAAAAQAARRVRHRRGSRRLREELGGADLPGAGGRADADGRDRVGDVPRGPIAAAGRHHRRARARARGRPDRARRQPAGRHHRATSSRVRDEGRPGGQKRRFGPVTRRRARAYASCTGAPCNPNPEAVMSPHRRAVAVLLSLLGPALSALAAQAPPAPPSPPAPPAPPPHPPPPSRLPRPNLGPPHQGGRGS